ncbi:MAG: folate-binding protein [Pseudomonadota bacterium]
MTEPLRLDRALFTISGPDTTEFLQNLVTNDVTLLVRQPVVYAGILSPQGKVTADFILWRTDEGVLVDVHARAADALRAKLTLYRLRAKVEIGPIEAGLGVFAGDLTGAAILSAADPRRPEAGLRAIRLAQGAAPQAEPEAYRARRIEAGLPNLAHDAAPEEVFALEALFEELNGVDFQKGCFVGQENVSRMKRRATTRKKFCPVTFEGAAPPFGTAITVDNAEIGWVRSGIEGRAIALMRLDRAQETLEKGCMLLAEGKVLHLAAPSWLIMPSATETA